MKMKNLLICAAATEVWPSAGIHLILMPKTTQFSSATVPVGAARGPSMLVGFRLSHVYRDIYTFSADERCTYTVQ